MLSLKKKVLFINISHLIKSSLWINLGCNYLVQLSDLLYTVMALMCLFCQVNFIKLEKKYLLFNVSVTTLCREFYMTENERSSYPEKIK